MEAALNEGRLYYRELMGTDRNVAYNLFRAMDRNGDGWVSVNEVIAFMAERGMPVADTRRVFEGMGLTGNQSLSIEDLVAFGYIFMTRPSCDRCRSIIFHMYYTCMQCHDMWTNGQGANTYDLCPVCFDSGDFLHRHSPFKQIMQSTTERFHGGGQGTAMSYDQGLQGTTTSFHGGGQGTAVSYNRGLQWTTTSFHGGREEGMEKFSKERVLQILANFAAIGSVATGVAMLTCSIM